MSSAYRQLTLPDGRVLAYTEWGDPGGRPVLYCHGFPGSRLEARLADRAALDLGIRLIAADRPGFGRSTFRAGRRLSDWPADLARLADSLSIGRFHLIGVSGGGPYAIACGQQLGERIERLAIVCGLGEFSGPNPTAGMYPAAAASIRFCLASPGLAHWTYRRVIGPTLRRHPEKILKLLVGNAVPADREVLSDPEVRNALLTSFRECFAAGSAGPTHELGLFTTAWDIDPAKVQVPVDLWHGDLDRTVPARMGRRHARLLPRVDAHFIAVEGHFSLIVRYMRDILAALLAR